MADLGRMPPTDLADVAEPGQLVLRPDLATIVRRGQRSLAARAVAAKLLGGMHGFNRTVVERRFKPVQWVLGDGVPIGYSATDLERLARLGEAWLEHAGVRRQDVVVSLLVPGPSVAHHQLVLGSRRMGASAIHLGPSTPVGLVERLVPSVLAGTPYELGSLLGEARRSGCRLAELRTVVAVGEPLGTSQRAELESLAEGAAVVSAWAPPGVRALWSECREGTERHSATGYHVWDGDVLEVVEGGGRCATSGELLWTGLGWRGSAVLRLRTWTSVTVEREPCPACGRREARVIPLAPLPRTTTQPTVPVPVPSSAPAQHPASLADAPNIPTPLAGPAMPASGAPLVAPEGQRVDIVPGVGPALLDGEPKIAAWQVQYRLVAGHRETIVILAPALGAALVPLIHRLDRHLHATQFVVLGADELASRVNVEGRVVEEGPYD